MDYFKLRLVYALLQLTLFMHCCTNFLTHYCNWNHLYTILQLINFKFTIANNHSFHMYYFQCKWTENFCMHYYNGQLLYALLEVTIFVFIVAFGYKNYQLFRALLYLLIYVGDIAINFFCMHYCNWQHNMTLKRSSNLNYNNSNNINTLTTA